MSKLEELIQKYCPDGVESVKFIDYANVLYGFPFDASLFTDDSSYIPLIRIRDVLSGKAGTYYKGEYPHGYIIKKGDILVGMDGNFNLGVWNDIDGLLNQRVCKLCTKDDSILINGFIKHYMRPVFRKIEENTVGGSVKHLSAKVISSIEIPLPPLPIQEEIVRILDTFSELQAELQAEQQKREQQYDYYQDLLLNKSQFSHLVSIGDICDIKKGNTPIQKAKEGDYPLVVTTMERRSSDTYQFNANAVCIPLISSRGHGVASLNHVYYQEGKFALGNILCAVIPHDEKVLKAKFLYYYLEYAKDYTLVPLMKGGANVSMHCSDIEKVKIPLPPLDEQERIISILDKFDSLTNNLTAGLPAEIEKRKQQFEFYRDKLLTFKRKEA